MFQTVIGLMGPTKNDLAMAKEFQRQDRERSLAFLRFTGKGGRSKGAARAGKLVETSSLADCIALLRSEAPAVGHVCAWSDEVSRHALLRNALQVGTRQAAYQCFLSLFVP